MVRSTLIGILGLALLMVLHEGGHFVAARAFGMRVTRFSIGFGPTLLKLQPRDGYYWLSAFADRVKVRLGRHDPAKRGPTIYQLAVIPFLAYVQIAGMNPLEDIDEGDKGSYANASLLGRIVTIFSGPFANYLFASVFFFLSLFFGGRVDPGSTDVEVLKDHPAAAADMRSGDKIVEVGGTKVKDWEQMAAAISQHPAQPTEIIVLREGARVSLTITPNDEKGKGKIGVMAAKKRLDAVESFKLALTEPPMVVKNVAVSLGELVTGKAQGDIVGPVGLVRETARMANQGWIDLCNFLGVISAYLGAFNLIPFPALDGGRLMFLGYEAATRRRPNARIEAHIHAIGLFMMIGLMVYVTFAKDLGLGLK